MSVLIFTEDDATATAMEQLQPMYDLLTSRFGYTPSGERRETKLARNPDAAGWLTIAGDHPATGGRAVYGMMGVRTHGHRLVIVNTMSATRNGTEDATLLAGIDRAF